MGLVGEDYIRSMLTPFKPGKTELRGILPFYTSQHVQYSRVVNFNYFGIFLVIIEIAV
jgi:hypothetical protein